MEIRYLQWLVLSNYSLKVFALICGLVSLLFLQANKAPYGADLMGEFEDALLKQRPDCESGSRLIQLLDNRNKSHIQRRLSELEGYYRVYYS
jgi:hypothetical protein